MANPFLGNLSQREKKAGPGRVPTSLGPRDWKEYISTAVLPSSRENKPQWGKWNTQKAVEEGFKASTWVYAAVSRISTAAGTPPWVVEELVEGENENETVAQPVGADEPLQALLDRPNPFMTTKDIIRRVATHLYLGGNGIITKIRAGKRDGDSEQPVAELWPMHPAWVAPVLSKTDFISRYDLKNPDGTGKAKPMDVKNVIHIQLVDPNDPTWGMSPLQAAAKTVDADVKAVEWNMVAMQNRSVPDGVFTLDLPVTREQWEEARDQVKEQYMGTDNARAPWVVGNSARWQQMAMSPAEMDFIESRKLTREEILAVFGVPPPLVGVYENATLANIKTAREIFWLDTMLPFLDVVEEALWRSLVPDFYDEASARKMLLRYDTSNVDALQEDMGQKMETAQSMWETGIPWSVINDRLELGMTPWPGWDVPYVPTSMVPAGEGTGLLDAMEGVL